MNPTGNGDGPWHERGAVLPYIIVVVFFLSFVLILSLSRTTSELKGVGSSRRATDQFYSADTALAVSCENKGTWLTDDFQQAIEAEDWDGAVVRNLSMYDENGNLLETLTEVDADDDRWGKLTFRPIQDEDEDKANEFNLPVQPHEVPPPAGSGYGMGFKVRRYGVNAISPDGSKEIQAGVWVLGQ